MLYIDKKQVTVDELADALNISIPVKKISKTPIFEVHPSRKKKDILNGGYISPLGSRLPASFIADVGGRKLEIRYAESTYDEMVGERMITKYSPTKVMFRGITDLIEEYDRAIYMWLHPVNEQSPFRSQMREAYHWSFVDDQAKAQSKMAKFNELRKAMNFIESLSGDHLKTIAKGMGIHGVEGMEEVVIQATLSEIASQNEGQDAHLFNERVAAKETLFTGIIRNAVDREIFKLIEVYQKSRWVWNAGPQRGQIVVEIATTNASPEQVLIDHINGHINDFYAILMDLQTKAVAENVSKDFFAKTEIDTDKLFGKGVFVTKDKVDNYGNITSKEVDIDDIRRESPAQTSVNGTKQSYDYIPTGENDLVSMSEEERAEWEEYKAYKLAANKTIPKRDLTEGEAEAERKVQEDLLDDITGDDDNEEYTEGHTADDHPNIGLSEEEIQRNLSSVSPDDIPDYLKPAAKPKPKPNGKK